MEESEIRRLIRQEVRQALAPILMGLTVSNQDNTNLTVQRFPSEGQIQNVRNIQSYGFSSRAPANTPSMIIPINYDSTQLNKIGDYDKNRPTTNDGETILYDANGHIIYLSASKMQFGSKSSANPMMLGDIVQTLLSNMLQEISVHQHISGAPGYLTSAPTDASTFLGYKASPVGDGGIISSKCYTEK